ncbi:competence protein CoiA family protein [Algoriphagus taiwanensis]|uniref:Competence protein CoiA-like family protein n=1 Tax=Algoriphagus taiwanensis TaxID=1445656 RepID=A0ABQ6Q459_9BACT|nr:hypothetical protein Ataiwa_26020 [Algoriphagus taiwanensis]
MQALLTLGLRNGKLFDISEVENGIKCNCFCPNCGERLIAVSNIESKAYKNSAHFRHESGVECVGAYESALHMLAKEVFSKLKEMQLPDYHFDYDQSNKFSLEKSFNIIKFEDCQIEKRINLENFYFVPDLIGIVNGTKIFIEFAFSHYIDVEKKEKIIQSQVACIEINIKGMELDPKELENLFLSKSDKVYWISNPKQDRIYKEKEKRRKELNEKEKQNKLQALKEGKVNSIQITNNKLWICPKKINFFEWFKTSKYNQHPILKEIANGEFWNEKFYGHYSTEEYIFFKGEKVFTSIYPYLGVDDDPNRPLLRDGLKRILERKSLDSNLCKYCTFDKGLFEYKNKTFQICSFKGKKGFIKDIL